MSCTDAGPDELFSRRVLMSQTAKDPASLWFEADCGCHMCQLGAKDSLAILDTFMLSIETFKYNATLAKLMNIMRKYALNLLKIGL